MVKSLRALIIALSSIPSIALASVVIPLDTFPAPNAPFGSDAGLFARVLDSRQIAVPFHLETYGHITKIETGIFGSIVAGTPCGALAIGISGGGLPGFPQWNVRTSGNDMDITCHNNIIQVGSGFLTLSDLDIPAGPGDYWLFTDFVGDTLEAHWLTNNSILSDQWATKICDPAQIGNFPRGCDFWQTLEERGIDPSPIPVARITFEIPEPATAASFIGAGLLVFSWIGRRRRNSLITILTARRQANSRRSIYAA